MSDEKVKPAGSGAFQEINSYELVAIIACSSANFEPL